MKRGRVLVAAALSAGLIGLGILVLKTNEDDPGHRARVGAYLRDLKEIDAEWSLDVLRSKIDINKNYDPVSRPLHDLHGIPGVLGEFASHADPQALRRPIANLVRSFTDKVESIERFKMEDSLLKNSLRFLPTAVAELSRQIRTVSPGGPKPVAGLHATQMEHTADAILTLALRYHVSPDPALAADLEEHFAQLARDGAQAPSEVDARIDDIVNHARVLMRQKANEDAVLARIAGLSTAGDIEKLAGVFDELFDANAREQALWRQGLIAYSAALFALLIFAAIRLFASYRSLDQANTTLEDRVRDRTSALTSALGELKESQLQLVQAEKMASLGQMVAGIAHEINTPLAYVKSSVQVAKGCMKSLNALVEESDKLIKVARTSASQMLAQTHFDALGEVTTRLVETDALRELDVLLGDGIYGIEQISEIVLNLKNFSRLDRASNDQYNLNDAVESTLKIAQNIVKRRVIRKVLGEITAIECSPTQINQVLLNLITNACHATADDNGTVSIVTKGHKDGVIVQVIDNGHGIPAEHRSKIFDPFFTTKKVGDGTGLGLSIAQRIVKEHGGWITVSSQVGKGTLFTLFLPRVRHAASAVNAPASNSELVYMHSSKEVVDDQSA